MIRFYARFIPFSFGERSGLQRRLSHEAPHSKYVNCRNHRLALVFVHRMPQFKRLREVDAKRLSIPVFQSIPLCGKRLSIPVLRLLFLNMHRKQKA